MVIYLLVTIRDVNLIQLIIRQETIMQLIMPLGAGRDKTEHRFFQSRIFFNSTHILASVVRDIEKNSVDCRPVVDVFNNMEIKLTIN